MSGIFFITKFITPDKKTHHLRFDPQADVSVLFNIVESHYGVPLDDQLCMQKKKKKTDKNLFPDLVDNCTIKRVCDIESWLNLRISTEKSFEENIIVLQNGKYKENRNLKDRINDQFKVYENKITRGLSLNVGNNKITSSRKNSLSPQKTGITKSMSLAKPKKNSIIVKNRLSSSNNSDITLYQQFHCNLTIVRKF